MEELLRELLNRLVAVSASSSEIYDTECRERMGDAVFDGFIRPVTDYVLPSDFALYTAAGNEGVREAIADYIALANRRAAELGLTTFKQRLYAFQNGAVKSEGQVARYYDDFFGYMPPDEYDETGQALPG